MRLTIKIITGCLVVSLLILMTRCSLGPGGILNTEPFGDFIKDNQGNLMIQDTPRMWGDWTDVVNHTISVEVAGNRAPAGEPNWNEYWVSLIETNQTGRENPQRYINYIIERREAAGLPPLEGYP
jgi:hypothetical protein